MSSRMRRIRSNWGGTPFCPGNQTSTVPIPVSWTLARMPQPWMARFTASSVRLSPSTQSRALMAARRSASVPAAGRQGSAASQRARPSSVAVGTRASRSAAVRAASTPSSAAPRAKSSASFLAPAERS